MQNLTICNKEHKVGVKNAFPLEAYRRQGATTTFGYCSTLHLQEGVQREELGKSRFPAVFNEGTIANTSTGAIGSKCRMIKHVPYEEAM